MKQISEMSLEDLYGVKGRIVTDLETLQNDLQVINKKIMELRQENRPKVLDTKIKQ